MNMVVLGPDGPVALVVLGPGGPVGLVTLVGLWGWGLLELMVLNLVCLVKLDGLVNLVALVVLGPDGPLGLVILVGLWVWGLLELMWVWLVLNVSDPICKEVIFICICHPLTSKTSGCCRKEVDNFICLSTRYPMVRTTTVNNIVLTDGHQCI